MFFLDKFNPIEEYWYTPTNHKYKGNEMNELVNETVPTQPANPERKRKGDGSKTEQR